MKKKIIKTTSSAMEPSGFSTSKIMGCIFLILCAGASIITACVAENPLYIIPAAISIVSLQIFSAIMNLFRRMDSYYKHKNILLSNEYEFEYKTDEQNWGEYKESIKSGDDEGSKNEEV